MEKRIGTLSIVVSQPEAAVQVNLLLSLYAPYILARQGLPLHQRGISIITVIMEATTDTLNALTGKLGKTPGVTAKSFISKQ